jgi:hypothetical protein
MIEKIYIDDKPLHELLQLFNCDISNDIDFYTVIAHKICLLDIKYIFRKINDFTDNQLVGIIHSFSYINENNSTIDTILDGIIKNNNNDMVLNAVIRVFIVRKKDYKWNIIKYFIHHKSEYVRGACYEYAAFSLPEHKSIKLLILAVNDNHHLVREIALDEIFPIVKYGCLSKKLIKELVDSVENILLCDKDEFVIKSAFLVLKELKNKMNKSNKKY